MLHRSHLELYDQRHAKSSCLKLVTRREKKIYFRYCDVCLTLTVDLFGGGGRLFAR